MINNPNFSHSPQSDESRKVDIMENAFDVFFKSKIPKPPEKSDHSFMKEDFKCPHCGKTHFEKVVFMAMEKLMANQQPEYDEDLGLYVLCENCDKHFNAFVSIKIDIKSNYD